MTLGLLKRSICCSLLGLGVLASAHAQLSYQPESPTRTQNATDPRHRAKVHTELGAAYFEAGNMAIALDHLKIALDADSSYYQANNVRGLVYAALKEDAKAEAEFQRALGMAPNDPEVNNNYGWYLCGSGKERQSIAYFLNALKSPLYETPDRAYTNAGSCALKAGDLDGAQNYLLKALQLSRDGALAARLQLAHVLYRRGNFEESRIYLGEVIKNMDPPTAEALWLGIRLERKRGDRMAEGSYASRLRGRYPTSPEYQEFLKGNFE